MIKLIEHIWTLPPHESFNDFATVMAGVLFATTFWRKPQEVITKVAEKLFKFFERKLKEGLSKSMQETKSPKTFRMNQEDFFYAEAKNAITTMEKWLRRIGTYIYAIFALPLGAFALTWLFLGKTENFGGKNIILTLPIFLVIVLWLLVFSIFAGRFLLVVICLKCHKIVERNKVARSEIERKIDDIEKLKEALNESNTSSL